MEDRRKKTEIINSITMAIILFAIAFLFWPQKKELIQSNELDESKVQIKVIVKRINIRADSSTESEDIGDVYQDEIYTVESHVDKEEYYWYKITTSTGITGYIASDPKSEYVTLINGTIDRTPPEISCDKELLVFQNGKASYQDITCIDNYSSCNLSLDNSDARYIKYIATDEDGNKSVLEKRYYNVYELFDLQKEEQENLKVEIKKKKIENVMVLSMNYELKKKIESQSKSMNYVAGITFFDENFQEIKDVFVEYNKETLEEGCINQYDLSLKEEYLEKELESGQKLCVNYTIQDIDPRARYLVMSLAGVENYNKDDNYLANYYSRYYKIAS